MREAAGRDREGSLQFVWMSESKNPLYNFLGFFFYTTCFISSCHGKAIHSGTTRVQKIKSVIFPTKRVINLIPKQSYQYHNIF